VSARQSAPLSQELEQSTCRKRSTAGGVEIAVDRGEEEAHRVLLCPVAGCQLPVKLNGAKRDGKSLAGDRDHVQVPEESARVGRIWRMLMLEEGRLRLVGNSASGRRGGLCGRRRGGVVAPMTMRGSIVLIVSDRPAAAIGAVVRNSLDVSNPRMITAVAVVELRWAPLLQRRWHRPDGEKGAKQSQL
jgi:hypothetical protein